MNHIVPVTPPTLAAINATLDSLVATHARTGENPFMDYGREAKTNLILMLLAETLSGDERDLISAFRIGRRIELRGHSYDQNDAESLRQEAASLVRAAQSVSEQWELLADRIEE